MTWKRPLLLVVPLLLALLVSACGGGAASNATPAAKAPATAATTAVATPKPAGPSATATIPATPAETPKLGGTLTFHAQGVNRGDPHQIVSVLGQSDIHALLFNSIVFFDRFRGITIPALAETWEYKTPTELILHIRQGVKFQEKSLAKGRELDATDVALSLDRVRQGLPFIYAVYQRNAEKIEVVDKFTVRVTFKKVDSNYLYYASSPNSAILPREVIEKYGKQGDPMASYVGSGPFSAAKYGATNAGADESWYGTGAFVPDFTAYRADVSGAATKNPAFWMPGRPYLDRVQWVQISDKASRVAALATGQLDVDLVPTQEKKRFEGLGFQFFSTAQTIIAGDHLALNNSVYPFNDWRVRKAANLASDKEELMAIVAQNYGCINVWLGCNKQWFLSSDDIKGQLGVGVDMKTNLAEAKKLLADAGVDPTKVTLRIPLITASPYPTVFERTLTITTQLQNNLGFKVKQEAPPACPGCTAAEMRKKDGWELFNVTAGGLGGLIVDNAAWDDIHSGARQNASLWFNAEADRLIEAQEGELDLGKRRLLLQELQRHVTKDGNIPAIMTVRNYDWLGVNPKIRNYTGTGYFISTYAWQYAWTWLEK